MSKIELLAPAGSFEALIAGVQNGADAIYLGGNDFNARASANNFDQDELKNAVEYAHLYGVKIYVTVNTLYYDHQFLSLFDYISYLYSIQVDALIIQDIGLFDQVRKYYPDFEIHMSTQASIHNLEGVQYFERLGASRVVLARENTIDEIRSICKHANIELEVFIHGALCMSYSGQCLMSSLINKRSGNQGKCGQPCRLKYQLEKDGKLLDHKEQYLLSMKDLCTIDHIGELIDAGVTSFKIEGRMKRPEYVATIVKQYRNAIDHHLNNTTFDNKNNALQDMKKVFYRGFTNGYLFHDPDNMSEILPGHRGIMVGTVLFYDKKRKRVRIQLSDTLKQQDRISFYPMELTRTITKLYKNNKLVNKASKNDVIEIELNQEIKKNNPVYKTYDYDLIQQARNSYQTNQRKIPISISFIGHIHAKAKLILYDGNHRVEIESDSYVEQARDYILEPKRIETQLKKLGNTIYTCNDIEINFDQQATLSIQELNQMRRTACNQLDELRKHHILHKHPIKQFHVLTKSTFHPQEKRIHVKVYSLKQLKVVIQYPIHTIYFPFDKDLQDAYFLCKEKQIECIPYINFLTSIKTIKQFMQHPLYLQFDSILVSDYGALQLLQKEKNCILDYHFNLTNSYSIQHFSTLKKIVSFELSKKQINQFADQNNLIVPIYGKSIAMISKHCPISFHYFHTKKINCNQCKKGSFSLVNHKNEHFDIMMDPSCNMHLLHCKAHYLDQIFDLQVNNLLLIFTNESLKTIKDVLKDYLSYIIPSNFSQNKTNEYHTNGYFDD